MNIENKLNGKEWCVACIDAVGDGRGGGKPDSGNASITNESGALEKIISAAVEYSASRGVDTRKKE